MYKIKNIKNQVFLLAAFVLFMLAMSFAAVPLYKLFCQVTGCSGPQKLLKTHLSKPFGVIKVRFDSSTEKQAPLYFEPKQKVIKVNIGENNQHFTELKQTKNEITTMSVLNVTPLQAGKYFNKIDCFCFEEQTLSPNQEVDMLSLFLLTPQ